MARLEPLVPAQMTDLQRQVHDESLPALGEAGTIAQRDLPAPRPPRPFTAWLRSPELARRAFRLGEFVRGETSLPARLVQIAALLVARQWSAQYLWQTRKAEALQHGVSSAIVDAIAQRQVPDFTDRADRAAHAFSQHVLIGHAVPDAVYAEAVAVLGEAGVVELVGVLGYYTLVAMTLTTFELGPPEGTPPELAP
jgi:4-carboxymuconolactone decarboxylase